MASFNMPRNTSNVTDRSAERREAFHLRQAAAMHDRGGVIYERDTSEEEENNDDDDEGSSPLVAQQQDVIEDMKELLERRDAQILGLRRQFANANTRISILTEALLQSLQEREKCITTERQMAISRRHCQLENLSAHITNMKNIIIGDQNEYALARLDELHRKIQ